MGLFEPAYQEAFLDMKVVIVGGGFGGVKTALNLARDRLFEVKLISDHTYFEYHAALYRSATGRSPLEVAIPLQEFFEDSPNVEVVKDKIIAVDPNRKTVSSEGGSKWTYDVLVLAVGSVTAYYNIRGLKKYSYGVKTIHQALELKRHLHDDLIAGHEERNYVVVGGGATGVELAAELTAYLGDIRKKHRLPQHSYDISLVEASERVMPQLPAGFSHRIERRLKKLGVRLYLNTPVKSETYQRIKLPTGSIETHTVVWTAGMTNNPLFETNDFFETAKNKKVIVNEHLEAAKDIYVIGDSAATKYGGMAQTALYDANFIVANLKRQIRKKSRRPYVPKLPIYAIPVGPRWAAVLWGKFETYGYLGWVLRRLADLRLYLKFLPIYKALTVWRYGIVIEEVCPVCKAQLG